jgi:hypothetical protein
MPGAEPPYAGLTPERVLDALDALAADAGGGPTSGRSPA